MLDALGWPGAESGSQFEGRSGVELIETGIDAFAVRQALIEQAERSIDLQYYIWHDDLTGALMLEHLRQAASRGVRVRLLVDDNGIEGLDATLRWLADLPNIDVRVFNPFRTRWFKPLDFLFRFRHANRRMHSKSFTVDGVATIVGGRNIGDEYFAATAEGVFADLDALCVGTVVGKVAASFEDFWTSPLVTPIETVNEPIAAARRDTIEHALKDRTGGPDAASYAQNVKRAPVLDRMSRGGIAFTRAAIELIADPPHKAFGSGSDASWSGERRLVTELTDILGIPQRKLLIVSGYFVPTDEGVRDLTAMAARGVDVRILTNSYAATDVGMVHAGYARHRLKLVEAGVRLFEVPAPHDQPRTSRKLTTGVPRKKATQPGPTLHAKIFASDGRCAFVGSLNLDPRSFWLNTELGILIDSTEMAGKMETRFEEAIAASSYRLVARDGQLGWVDERDDEPQVELAEPGTSVWSRLLVLVFGRLRIDWLL